MNANIIMYIIAYLLGSIPFGLLIAKYFGNVDLLHSGSGSIGATNVLRVLKEKDPKKAKIFGLITILCDALKGLLPIIIASFMGFDINVLWTMAVLAIIGHCFSIFLKFEGGKGVATSFGVFLFFLPIEALIGIVVWLLVGKFLKISSIASLSGIFSFVLLSFILHFDMVGINTHAPIFFIAFIIVYKHIPNIVRLIQRKEDKVA
ncbi:acyl phosphate:glycerol-3-phosphate acyltransferase [Campylobacter blaseri]|uniref:Glycerol-3-phosphate acyltransferase n=1 Tax=Campylobacter blaseri TaxID=2042961 RepID=A0A2P8R180_9BACT|nr:glycerol-3-phosphate 1-O-acyltransferase PlsY [Campylobacter blaseri]PSM52248.1 acyl-phosphate--glycerol-3-phosphate O-acyltransferase [Campylobacter blaseri]PSM54014.1 acyl-phosphate--glycerol-3-phosphate O-acyltransferase [Campylobacter blaseri]QKF85452.1 acyl phosphate:glycerol-3-phosphate acyltransferase [Campylobacter blaseri]